MGRSWECWGGVGGGGGEEAQGEGGIDSGFEGRLVKQRSIERNLKSFTPGLAHLPTPTNPSPSPANPNTTTTSLPFPPSLFLNPSSTQSHLRRKPLPPSPHSALVVPKREEKAEMVRIRGGEGVGVG